MNDRRRVRLVELPRGEARLALVRALAQVLLDDERRDDAHLRLRRMGR